MSLLKNRSEHIKSLIAGAFALVVLFSSFGMSFGFHLCKNEIKDFSFLGNVEECSSDGISCQEEPIPLNSITRTPCCQNQNIYSQSVFFDDAPVLLVSNSDFEMKPAFSLLELNPSINAASKYDFDLRPPPDIYAPELNILIQSFLI